ncbi:hypothetical protein [Herbaspirillum sp. alder98]|uniref:hypothetical protein n=1 Tax=Herbaspirillum sp. alder98 TaxID=2913096 RepID=UPI001CD8B6EE|nr:hypothetical protein [Herbaspirillum sp. alder98]MCA1325336.1 hypothetical protein [Herbaspirillum sp. alder98]
MMQSQYDALMTLAVDAAGIVFALQHPCCLDSCVPIPSKNNKKSSKNHMKSASDFLRVLTWQRHYQLDKMRMPLARIDG